MVKNFKVEKVIFNGNCDYSEIFLNKKAKPIGVFYINDCQNFEEVKEYAKKHNLPLVNINGKTFSNNPKYV